MTECSVETLYKGQNYFQIWQRQGSVRSQRGTVGQRGTILEIPVQPSQSVEETIRQHVVVAVAEGYAPLPSVQYTQIVVCYSFTGWEAEDVAIFEVALRDLLGNLLTWTANGLYDGYSVGYESLSAWLMVIDPTMALSGIVEVLASHGYLHTEELDVRIAVRHSGVHTIVYPPEHHGERLMLADRLSNNE